MKEHGWIGLGVVLAAAMIGGSGCGLDRYDAHFGLGSGVKDGVSTETSVDRLHDGVVPAEPGAPEKPKKGEKGQPEAERKDDKGGTEKPASP